MQDRLVTIAGRLTSAEAELARIRLARHGVRSYPAGVDLVTWFWHYSIALGGARLQVAAADAERAVELLAGPGRTGAAVPQRRCACGESLDIDWVVCWRCGTAEDGRGDAEFFVDADSPSQLPGLQRFEGLLLLFPLALLVAWAIPVLVLPALVIPVALAVMALPAEEGVAPPSRCDPEAGAALPAVPEPTETGDELSWHTLVAAIFGLFWFPPLTVLSVWNLFNFDAGDTPASSKGNACRFCAWFADLFALGLFALLLGLILGTADAAGLVYYLLQQLPD